MFTIYKIYLYILCVILAFLGVCKSKYVDSQTATCSRWFFARGFFYPQDGDDTFHRNVGSDKNYTAPYPGSKSKVD
jgi:hypothetical protein